MATKDRFSYETQALLSIFLAGLSAAAAALAIALIARNYRPETGFTLYSAGGLWFPILGATLLGSILLSGAGLALGFNSAGQKRNTKSSRSWLGFFLSAGALTLALVTGLFFYFTRYSI